MSEGIPSSKGAPVSAEVWKSREELVLGREYFQFQYDFAKEMAERTGMPFMDMVKRYTTFLRSNIYELNDDGSEKELKPGVTEENMVDFAYEIEKKSVAKRKGEEMPYSRSSPEGGRFGCFRYDYHAEDASVESHFFNAEFDETGPLQGDKLSIRKSEFADMLRDIKTQHPEAKTMRGSSWLLSLPAFRMLFTDKEGVDTEIDRDPDHWHRGTIWGQFMDGKYQLRTKMTERFLKKARELPIEDLVLALPLPPRKVAVPLEELYQQYGIEPSLPSGSTSSS